MPLDFPATPTTGQLYPTAPAPGQPVYRWTGVLWTTKGVTRPPLDKRTLWTDGSRAMTAELTLVGDPASALQAADRHYIDSHLAALSPQPGIVRYDVAQSLASAEAQQSRDNMGVVNAFPAGAVMLFYQAAAPVGWTQVTSQNDKALRVTSGAGGVAGGSNSFSSVMAQSVVGNHTLSASEMPTNIKSNGSTANYLYFANNSACYVPYCTSGFGVSMILMSGSAGWFVPGSGVASFGSSANVYASFKANVHSTNTGGGAHNHPVLMDIAYCDVVIATKN